MTRGLIVSQFPVLPATQGNRTRLLGACEEFKKRGVSLDFLYYPREDGGKFDVEQLHLLNGFFNSVYIVPSDNPWPDFINKYQLSTEIWHESVGQYFSYISRRIIYDFVYVNYAPYAHIFARCAPEIVRVLDTHDKLSDRRDFLESQGQLPDFFSLSISDEGALAASADLVISIKDVESDYYRTVSNKPVITIGVPLTPDQNIKSIVTKLQNKRLKFGFIGSSNAVNALALNELFQNLLCRPMLSEQASFYIVGRVLDDVPIPSRLLSCVQGTRFVADLSDFYSDCDVIIVPTIRSTGLKIKSVEALSFGKPVLATADGFDGLESVFPFHNCRDQNELLDYCELLIKGDLDKRILEKATQDLALDYTSRYKNNIDVLMSVCSKIKVAVILGEDGCIDDFYACLFSLMFFIRRRCEVDVYCSNAKWVSLNFLRAIGRRPDDVRMFVPIPSENRKEYDIVFTNDAHDFLPLLKSAIVVRSSRDSVFLEQSSLNDDYKRSQQFSPIWKLDFSEEQYWGSRRRLVLFVGDNFSQRYEHISLFLESSEFSIMKGDYDEIQVVAIIVSVELWEWCVAHGIKCLPYREYLFDDPWRSEKHLVILGGGCSDQSHITVLFSISNTVAFVDCDDMHLVAKMVLGSDVWVGRFNSPNDLLAILKNASIASIYSKIVKTRYHRNAGYMLDIVKIIKEYLIKRAAMKLRSVI